MIIEMELRSDMTDEERKESHLKAVLDSLHDTLLERMRDGDDVSMEQGGTEGDPEFIFRVLKKR
jgi:hypothetical protein